MKEDVTVGRKCASGKKTAEIKSAVFMIIRGFYETKIN